jgi:hypothetical protein
MRSLQKTAHHTNVSLEWPRTALGIIAADTMLFNLLPSLSAPHFVELSDPRGIYNG